MKKNLIYLLFCVLPVAVLAQTDGGAKTSKGVKNKTGTSTKVAALSKPKVSRSAIKAVEEITPIQPQHIMSQDDLMVAERVYTGTIGCGQGTSILITPDVQKNGFFTILANKRSYSMRPVESRTGAVRLEDTKAGVMWLQLGSKSMLMNQKLGQRIADNCRNPEQVAKDTYLRSNPSKENVLTTRN